MARGAGRRLLGYVTPYRWLFALSLVTTSLSSLLSGFTIVVLIPLLKHLFGTAGALQTGSTRLEALMDALLSPLLVGASPGVAVARIVVLLIMGLVLKNFMSYASSQLGVAMGEGLVRDLRGDLFEHLLRLHLSFYQRTRGGQLIAVMMPDVDQAKSAVTTSLSGFLQNAVLVVTTLAVLSQLSWRLTLLTLATAPILVVGMRVLLKRLRGHSKERARERGELTATVAERFGAIRLIRTYGAEDEEARSFRVQSDRYRKRVIRTQRFSSLTGPVSEIFGGLVVILIVWAGTWPSIVGPAGLSPEALIVFLIAALRMMSPIKSLSQYPAQLAIALASAERVFDLLDAPVDERDQPGEREAVFREAIRYEGVTFRYGTDEPVLRDISVEVPRGSIVAIVGPSGAGKSTLVDLLPRLQEPTAGRILMDGTPITGFTRRSLRRLMGVVSQETVLLNDTVRGNIAYGRPGASMPEVEAAAQAANAAEFIAQLPEGYQTVLGERGTRLSGGQRQRIAIARALLRDPPILILDEATSSLDTESERLVQQAIERLMRDRTVFVIAHRLSTVRDAAQILVLDAGLLVERGTHEELYRRNGLYRRLYDLQLRD